MTVRRKVIKVQAANVAIFGVTGLCIGWSTTLWLALGWYGTLAVLLLVCGVRLLAGRSS